METSEQEILAKIRTLLALERNYLAEERTALAEFRTGLALALLGPPASAVLSYIFSLFPAEEALLLAVLTITFLAVLTVVGIRTSLRSRSKLGKIRKRKRILKDRQVEIAKASRTVYDLLSDFTDLEDR